MSTRAKKVRRRAPSRTRAAVPPFAPAELARRLEELRGRVEPLVPDVDPGDLLLILENMLRGPGSGRAIFIRQARPGVYVI
jgi:hypothetical protein